MSKLLGPLFVCLLASQFIVSAVAAADLVGRASIIDGDTIEIHGQRIRLFGIDAPESRQWCEAGGVQYRCGQQSAFALSDHVGQRTVTCDQRDTDRYGRIVAVCFVAGEDLSAWLVSEGLALAYRKYSKDYVDGEDAARMAKHGIWQGEFVAPWEWRKLN